MAERVTGQVVQFELPLLALRGLSVLPGTNVTLQVGRGASLAAVEAAMSKDRRLLLVTQRDETVDNPQLHDLFNIGTLASIDRVVHETERIIRLTVTGLERARLLGFSNEAGYPCLLAEPLFDTAVKTAKVSTLRRSLVRRYQSYLKLASKEAPSELREPDSIADPGTLADLVADHVASQCDDRLSVLAAVSVPERLERVCRLLEQETELVKLERKIQTRVQLEMERTHKEIYLREQLKAIQKELGEEDPPAEAERYRKRIAKAVLPEEVQQRALQEVLRLEKMPAMAAEAVVVRGYLDWLLDLPWSTETTDRLDLAYAEQVLEQNHYGLKDVKERILEYLAVRQLTKSTRTPILCLVGAPGTGKTSLARSIATALDRRFTRVSLGGLRDEAEILGHRRTYVGAMPGRIIQGLRQAGARNPVFLLDEIDKIGADFRGDPGAALLTALDPEQNHSFSDHYLETSFDLTQVLFIATANSTHTIPRALLDRLEVIPIAGYTDDERLAIARQHLLPRQLQEHGLTEQNFRISTKALEEVVNRYAREPGVRSLERVLATLCRKAARQIITGRRRLQVTVTNLPKLLGRPRYEQLIPAHNHQVGVALGMAWTYGGGRVMPVEAMVVPGNGSLTLTGQLGDVMRESGQAAMTYIRAKSRQLGIGDSFHNSCDIHVHVPEGAVPKDGPSAGVSITVAIVSALTGRPVRADIALSGEITLRGRILGVGGIKEKVMAAYRAGIRCVILPQDNDADLDDLPPEIRRRMRFVLTDQVDQAIATALSAEAVAGGEQIAGR